MADFDSSLPVRTETAGDVIVKLADATVTSQQLAVEADGSINVNAAFTPGSKVLITDGTDTVEVNADGSLNITDNGGSITVDGAVTVSATNLDIRYLVFASDKVDASGSTVALDSATLTALESITVQNGSGGSAVNIQDGGNSITVDGSVTVSATNLDIRDLTHASDSVKVGDGSDFLAVNSDGSINVTATVTPTPAGTSVADYATATVAGGGNSTHTYTSVGNFYLTQIAASGSGKMKIVVSVNSAAKVVMFNSTASPNMLITLDRPILATTGQTVTIARTNIENQSQDLYSTVIGFYP